MNPGGNSNLQHCHIRISRKQRRILLFVILRFHRKRFSVSIRASITISVTITGARNSFTNIKTQSYYVTAQDQYNESKRGAHLHKHPLYGYTIMQATCYATSIREQ